MWVAWLVPQSKTKPKLTLVQYNRHRPNLAIKAQNLLVLRRKMLGSVGTWVRD